MTANEARAQLLELLAEQYRLIAIAGVERGTQARAAESASFVANGVEILRLAQAADLSAVPPSPPKLSRPPAHVPVAYNAEAIAAAKVRLEDIETRQEGRWLDHARALRGEIEHAENMTRP